jgi:endonuclease/exonuclease/phosphatase family metal-dependent hydrolase
VSYNVEFDTIFADTDPVQAPKIARIIQALQPDVINLQEIYDHTASEVAALMNSLIPLSGGATWSAFRGFDNVLVSKYPLSMTRSTTVPNPPTTSYAIGLVDLPDEQFAKDFYFMDAHFKCCGDPGGPEDVQRQRQADALVNWMRDARSPGGSVSLAAGTPMAVVGDLNMVGSLNSLNTLLGGNIADESTYGSDSPPDWDGTPLTDARPLHNLTGPEDYTWRDDASRFDPGRLDYVLYTDSVVRIAKQFVLNTVAMSPTELSAVGLLQHDVVNSPGRFDHLPLVVDFRFPDPGDYNADGSVDALDYEVWSEAFGTSNAVADGNLDGTVDAADYTVWRDHSGNGVSATALAPTGSVPEPTSSWLFAFGAGCVVARCRVRQKWPART